MKSILLPSMAVCLFAGCCHQVAVIDESIQCSPPAGFPSTCQPRATIKADATYTDLILVAQEDRKNLELCGANYAKLMGRAETCRKGVEAHNEEIKKANAANKK
ncbi:hypothetical protein [Duganella sp. Dugasp56]|uniref:hypothetical protein n=1 Tax=Duganella sp. Dugasp56 TaxID=3243046 RepID=UPI0039AECA69